MYCKAPKSKEFIAIRAIIYRRLYKLSSDALVTKFIKVFRAYMAHCLTCKKERANALFYPCKHNIVCYAAINWAAALLARLVRYFALYFFKLF